MKYRILGKTNIKVSAVGIETHQFSGMGGRNFSEEEVRAILKRAKELGINFIETGECYGNHKSEYILGGAIPGDRKDWILATKFGHENKGSEPTPAWSADAVLKQLNDSLKALRTDYVDIYQFHGGSFAEFNNATLWSVLKKQVEAGRIKHLGVALGDNVIIPDAHKIAERASTFGVEVLQAVYNRLDRTAENTLFPQCEKQHLGVIVRVPLAKGYLSDKFKPQKDFDEVRLALAKGIKKQEVPVGVDASEWAIAWCLRNTLVSTVVPGCLSIEQVESTAHATDLI